MQDDIDYWKFRLAETKKKWKNLCNALGLKQNADIEQFPKNYQLQANKLFTEIQKITENLNQPAG